MIELLLWPIWVVGIFAIGMLVDFNEESESHWIGGTFLTVVMAMLGLKLFGVPESYFHNIDYVRTLKCAAIYVGIGLVWSFIRFYRLSKKIEPCKIKDGDERQFQNNRYFRGLFERVPVWIAFWPPSMLWSSLSDLIAPFFEWIADMFKEVYIKLFELAIGGKIK